MLPVSAVRIIYLAIFVREGSCRAVRVADYRKGEQALVYCLAGNLLLSVFKGVVGFLGGSRALVADAFHSGSDFASTLVVYVSVKIAKKPADDSHMYGHGKIEPLAAMLVALMMMVTALLLVGSAVSDLIARRFVTPSAVTLVTVVASIIVKVMMFRVAFKAGRDINSEAITANAWDHRADAYSSIGTFTGILGSILGGYLQIGWLKYFDTLAGALIALLILKMAACILFKAAQGLMDASPEPAKVAVIKSIAENIEGVQAVSWIRGRCLGQHILVDMAVEVNKDITVAEGHDIAAFIKRQVMDTVKETGYVLVHINPAKNLGKQ